MRRLSICLALSIGAFGCSAIADFGKYQPRDGTMDAGDVDAGGGGDCDPACGDGRGCCDGVCTDLDTTSDCGACGNACADVTSGDPVCVDGACGAVCDTGFDDCNDDLSDGCEQFLVDEASCGACGNACPGAQLCATMGGAPACVASCPGGETQCGRTCADTMTSRLHCGGCNRPCGLGSDCVDGACVDDCPSGMGDCDGIAANGCEATLRMVYDDLDDDGYGAPDTLFLACPDEPNTADNDDDCDDAEPTINPGEIEDCVAGTSAGADGLDNDCDDATDEGPDGAGDLCSCVSGANEGLQLCDGSGGFDCDYPAEICNGLDDDCDDVADNGFACAAGATEACTMTIAGCTAEGVRTCATDCTSFGGCVIMEACDRDDDDCDGVVDEGVLALGAPTSVRASGGPTDVRAAVDPGMEHTGLVWAEGTSLYFGLLGASGSLIAGPHEVTSSLWTSGVESESVADIAWTGARWAVAYVESGGLVAVEAFTAAGGTATGAILSTAGGREVALDRVGGTNQVFVVTHRSDASIVGQRVAIPSDTSVSPGVEHVLEASMSGSWEIDPDVVTTSTGAFVACSVTTLSGGGGSQQRVLLWAVEGAASPESRGSVFEGGDSGRVEERVQLAYDSVSGSIGLLVRTKNGGTATAGGLLFGVLAPSGALLKDEQLVPDSMTVAHFSIGAAAEGGFGLAYATGPTSGRIERRDPEGVVWTSESLTTAAAQITRHVVGFPSGPVRYRIFGLAGPALQVRSISCM